MNVPFIQFSIMAVIAFFFFLRCKKWIVNSRRDGLTLASVGNLLVCALHFEISQFNCPTDLSSSRLLPSALPTLVHCPNPPKTFQEKRKAPTPRKPLSPKKRRVNLTENTDIPHQPTQHTIQTIQTTQQPTAHTPYAPHTTDSTASKLVQLEAEVKFLLASKIQLEKSLDFEKRTVSDLKRQNARLGAKNEQLEASLIHHDNLLKTERERKTEDILKELPDIPRALFEVLAIGGKRINWDSNQKALEISLAVFFKSPSAYSVLRTSGFILPHPKTLRARYQNVLENVGLCPKLLNMLTIRATALSDMEKHVTLALDGMKLRPGLTYDKHKDQLLGYEDFGCFGNSFSIADEAVVLMVRGLSLRWKQIIGYYAAFHSIKSQTLASIISGAVKEITNAGYVVDAVIMDQESSQWKWVDSVGVTPEEPFTHFVANPCFIIPDPPHLLKNLRNHLMTKDISFEVDGMKYTAKWQHVKELHRLDSLNPTRLVPKLSDNHIILPRGKKMKVSIAAQVFSHTASAAMKTLVEKAMMPSDSLGTVRFLQTVNDMWDFVNSSSTNAPPAKRAVIASSFTEAEKKFNFFSAFVNSWTFSAHNEKNVRNNLPFHRGWILCLASMKKLAEKLLVQDNSMSFLCLRKLNQDHVENLHCQIRGRNGFNDHPMLPAYVSAIKCLACQISTTELLESATSSGANCEILFEDDEVDSTEDGVTSHNIPCAASFDTGKGTALASTSSDDSEELYCVSNLHLQPLNVVQVETCAYIAGAVLRSLSKRLKAHGICEKCIILGSTGTPSTSSFTRNKEYKEGALIAVSKSFVDLSCSFEKYFISLVGEGLCTKHPRAFLIDQFTKSAEIQADVFGCEDGHKDMLLGAFLKTYCNIRLFHYIKLLNKDVRKGKKGNELNKDKKIKYVSFYPCLKIIFNSMHCTGSFLWDCLSITLF